MTYTVTRVTASSFFDDAVPRVRQHVDGPVERVEDGKGRREQLPGDLIHAPRLSLPVHGVRAGRSRLQSAGRRRTASPCRTSRTVVTDVYLRKRSILLHAVKGKKEKPGTWYSAA